MNILSIYKIWDMALQEEKVGLEFENEAGVTLHEEIDKKTFLRKQSLADFLTQKGITTSAGDDSIQNIYDIYANADRIWTMPQTGWVAEASTPTFVAPAETFGDQAYRLKKDPIAKETFSHHGKFDAWKAALNLITGSPILMYSIGIALAALVKGLLKIEASFGFYIYGKSSIGKTTCLRLAQSVQDNPANHNTWDITKGGIEECCFEHNSSLMVLDELRQISNNDRRLCEAVRDASYAISQGKARKRCHGYAAQMGFQEGSWNLIWLGSGEFSLHEMARTQNVELYKGQEVRMIEISAFYSKEYGIFKSLPEGETDSGTVIAKIEKIIKDNYGLLARKWIKKVTEYPNFQVVFHEKYDKAFKHIAGHFECQGGFLERMVRNICLPLTALIMASEMGLVTWTEAEIMKMGRTITRRALKNIDPTTIELKDMKTLQKKLLHSPSEKLSPRLYESKSELEQSINDGVIYKDKGNYLIPFRVFIQWFGTETYAKSVETTLKQQKLVLKGKEGYGQYTLGNQNCRIRMMSINLSRLNKRIEELEKDRS